MTFESCSGGKIFKKCNIFSTCISKNTITWLLKTYNLFCGHRTLLKMCPFVFFTKQRFIWLWNNTRVSKQCQFSFLRDLIPYTYVHNVPIYFSNCVTVFVRGDCSHDFIYSWKPLTLTSYSCACFTFFGKPVTRKPFPWRTVDAMASHNRSSSVSLNTHTRENQMNTHIQIHNPWERPDALEQTHTLD